MANIMEKITALLTHMPFLFLSWLLPSIPEEFRRNTKYALSEKRVMNYSTNM